MRFIYIRCALLLVSLLMLPVPPILAGSRGLFIEAQLKPAEPYIQAQLIYIVRLYHDDPYVHGYFVPPEIVDVVSLPLEGTESVEVEREGEHYWMREQRYLLFPQHSGTLVIPGMIFSGREAYARGKDLSLTIRSRPGKTYAGAWLPARDVRISEVWPQGDTTRTVGEGIERVVTIEAEGLTAAQLSPLPLPEAEGLRLRRSGVTLDDRIEGEKVVGRRIEYHTLRFTGAGRYELPATILPWWDTDQEQPQQTILPGRTFEIREAAGRAIPIETAGPEAVAHAAKAVQQSTMDSLKILPDILWYGSLMALVVILLLWFLAPPVAALLAQRLHLFSVKHELRRSCICGDATGAMSALRRWLKLCDGHEPPAAEAALRKLERAVYGQGGDEWEGREFWKSVGPILRYRRVGRGKRASAVLPGLIPE